MIRRITFILTRKQFCLQGADIGLGCRCLIFLQIFLAFLRVELSNASDNMLLFIKRLVIILIILLLIAVLLIFSIQIIFYRRNRAIFMSMAAYSVCKCATCRSTVCLKGVVKHRQVNINVLFIFTVILGTWTSTDRAFNSSFTIRLHAEIASLVLWTTIIAT